MSSKKIRHKSYKFDIHKENQTFTRNQQNNPSSNIIIKTHLPPTIRKSAQTRIEHLPTQRRDLHSDHLPAVAARIGGAEILRARVRVPGIFGRREVLGDLAVGLEEAGNAAFVLGVVGGLDVSLKSSRVVPFTGEVVGIV